MDSRFNKQCRGFPLCGVPGFPLCGVRNKSLRGLAILFVCTVVVLFVQGCRKKAPVATKEAEPKKEVPVKRTGSPQSGNSAPQSGNSAPQSGNPEAVLRSSLAGKWYPADAEILGKQIDGFFARAEAKPINNVIALILPHAGYRFSGQTAAYALKTTDKKYKRVVIIGPSHRVAMEEVLSVPRVTGGPTHYETPLGRIPLDVEFIDRLLKYSMFQNIPQVHKYEHSVQIELPLLQHSQKDFQLVPIVAGTCSLETIGKVGRILRSLIDDETLVIASSDFVHYGRNYGYVPFTENIPEQIRKLDMGAYEYIDKPDSKGFLEYKRRTEATICGHIPVAILLSMLGDGVEADHSGIPPVVSHLIKYTTSGEVTGDYSNSVSYLSIAFSGTWGGAALREPGPASAERDPILQKDGKMGTQIEPQASVPELTEKDKKQLLTLARRSIVYALEHRRVPEVSELDVTISEAMSSARAAFVTLKKAPVFENPKQGPEKATQLRGCIGDIFPQRPLYKSVIINAINAALNDRRFLPVTRAECNDITIEISALTVPEPVGSPDEIRIGTDGVVLNKAGRSAVFLPQVAPEQGWDLNQTLTQLSLKAGLAGDAWKEGASFLVFQAVVFGEGQR